MTTEVLPEVSSAGALDTFLEYLAADEIAKDQALEGIGGMAEVIDRLVVPESQGRGPDDIVLALSGEEPVFLTAGMQDIAFIALAAGKVHEAGGSFEDLQGLVNDYEEHLSSTDKPDLSVITGILGLEITG